MVSETQARSCPHLDSPSTTHFLSSHSPAPLTPVHRAAATTSSVLLLGHPSSHPPPRLPTAAPLPMVPAHPASSVVSTLTGCHPLSEVSSWGEHAPRNTHYTLIPSTMTATSSGNRCSADAAKLRHWIGVGPKPNDWDPHKNGLFGQRCRQNGTDRAHSSIAHFPSAYSWACARPKAGAWHSILVSHTGGRDLSTSAVICCFPAKAGFKMEPGRDPGIPLGMQASQAGT